MSKKYKNYKTVWEINVFPNCLWWSGKHCKCKGSWLGNICADCTFASKWVLSNLITESFQQPNQNIGIKSGDGIFWNIKLVIMKNWKTANFGNLMGETASKLYRQHVNVLCTNEERMLFMIQLKADLRKLKNKLFPITIKFSVLFTI